MCFLFHKLLCWLTINVIGPGSPDSVVRPIQGDSVIWRSRPGDVFVVSDDAHHLLVRIRCSEDHRVGPREEAIVTAISSGSVVLSKDCQRGKEQKLAECTDRWIHDRILKSRSTEGVENSGYIARRGGPTIYVRARGAVDICQTPIVPDFRALKRGDVQEQTSVACASVLVYSL